MSVEETWGHYFKPEVRKQGSDSVAKGAVVLSQASDTMIRSYVKGSGSARVSFTTDSIASETFLVDCSCSASGRGQLCKHIWATLLVVEMNYPDFLDSKVSFEKRAGEPSASSKMQTASRTDSPLSSARAESQAAFKAKQADYRKQQYQKQKQRQKDQKNDQKQAKLKLKSSMFQPQHPESVERALAYFAENGFPMEIPVEAETLQKARKILARVFHPDKGGTHEEVLTLNQNFDILIEYRG